MNHSLGSRVYLVIPSILVIMLTGVLNASKLSEFGVVDQEILFVKFLDGEVTHRDDGLGKTAFTTGHEDDMDTVKLYDPALNTTEAQKSVNWTLKSTDDPNYSGDGLNPVSCYRKTKMNGHAERGWLNSDFKYEYTYEHFIYLKLPHKMQQGKTYILEISNSINSDQTTQRLKFDVFERRSESVHVNLVGYTVNSTIKAADLYIWLGDGKARDYSSFVGNKVFIYNTESKQSTEVGVVKFWKKSSDTDVGYYNLTRSDVWDADFSGFDTPGSYRLAIEGVGCSQDFIISDRIYYDPFMVAVRGFYYMRIGQDDVNGIKPVPRRPLYIPGVSPEDTKVYLTTMHPYHSDWETFSSGDVWDKPNDWARFRKTGNPVNPHAKGGHSDALDWDRHLGHIAIIYDMLLPFFLTNGLIDDDNLGIAESGNGIPDILDEARNEVDFWLNLRDEKGYSHGLTNPNDKNELFQAAPTAVAAWASAANSAMLADCFRIAKLDKLKNEYRDSALAAYNYASGLADKMLDKSQGIGDGIIRGRDLKMMAAAFLYNLTGETKFEDVVKDESVVKGTNSILDDNGDGNSRNQVYATVAYLLTPQEVHYPELQSNMKASMINEAKKMEAGYCDKRPSRRATNDASWYFRTSQNVQRTIIAHSIADNETDRNLFSKAIVLEADYGLGRNPLNMIQMTTATTPLENKRSVINAYTSGRDDGSPGMHPGHTPYFNLDDWDKNMTMGSPSKLYQNCYPSDFKNTWPADEGYFNTRYVWAHVEFTPQQTMRGKMALYGYLYGIGKSANTKTIRYTRKISNNKGVSFDVNGSKRICIHDMAGRVIFSGVWNDKPELLFKRGKFSRGIYFVESFEQSGRKLRRTMWIR